MGIIIREVAPANKDVLENWMKITVNTWTAYYTSLFMNTLNLLFKYFQVALWLLYF